MLEDWEPKRLWDRLERRMRSWMDADGEEERDVEDPSILFHLAVTTPLLVVLATIARRLS